MPPLYSSTVTQTIASRDKENSTKRNATGDVADPCDFDYDDYMKETNKNSIANKSTEDHPLEIIWRNVIYFVVLHLASLYGVYRMFTSAMWQTNLFTFVVYIASVLGVTAGVHRLWSHRTYKATLPLRILLAFMFTISFQYDIYEWSQDHRMHHKFSETNADPYSAGRGFFFSHLGWLMCRRHPDVINKRKIIDMSDLLADPVVRFQKKYYLILVLLCCFVLPTVTPMYFWNETFLNSLLIPALFRLYFTLNMTMLVNSAAHRWGNRPYDVHINPGENALATLVSIGEGFHNFHHTFPYDYATSEWGIKYNVTTAFIDLMAFLGLAYDRKKASKSSIEARRLRTGPEGVKKPVASGDGSIIKED